MSSKTLLVARREFVENVRTKTFWIGILAFPVIFAIAILVGNLLNKAKDVRPYAVLDYSPERWLSSEVDRAAMQGDLGRLLGEREAIAELQDFDPQAVRARLQEAADAATHQAMRELMQVLLRLDDDDLVRLARSARDRSPPLDVIAKMMPDITRWARDHDPRELRAAFGGISLGKYERVPLPEVEGGDGSAVEQRLREMVNSGRLFAYFVIGADPLATGTDGGGRYVSNNLTDDDLRSWYSALATEVVRERRLAALQRDKGLTRDEAQALQARFSFAEKKVGETGAEEEVDRQQKAGQFAPVAFVYLLWIAVFTIAQMLLTNTIEEKSNRIIEVLLSSVTPHQLMTGKILGIAATGLTMVMSWVVFALIGIKFFASAVSGIPIDLVAIIGDPLYLSSFVAYFIAGYLLFAAVLVAIGSVCNSLKEAQNLMQPVIILLLVPLIAMVPVVQDPNGTVARILTYVPLYTPFLMMNRAGGPPPAWEYAATTVLIVVSVAAAFWAAGKVFRVGILMTGKPPKVREILRWLVSRG